MKSPYYTISNTKLKNEPDAKFYKLIQDGDNYIISFISGELSGKEKFVRISLDDFNRLKREEISIYEILRKYNTG